MTSQQPCVISIDAWRALKARTTAFVVASVLCVACWSARADEPARRVLMLYPYNNSFPAGVITGDAARKQLIAKSPTRLELYADYLDLARFPGEQHEERTAQYLADKYADKKPDVVVTLGPEALRFILKHRDAIAPMAPIVFAATSSAALTTINPPTDVTGVISDFDLAKTMALAERLQPNARHVVVVTGASEFDRRWVQTAQRQLARYEQRYETRYLVGLEHDALLDELKRLPRDTVVILTTIFADGAGRLFVPPDISEEVAKAASAPVYTPYDTYLGSGVVGGYVESFEAIGIAAGDLVLQLLTGVDPASVPPRLDAGDGYKVDARQLDRWQLSASNLPDDTTILFQEPALWQQHRDLALLAVAAFGLQTVIVLTLLVQIRKRKQAEAKHSQSQERMTFAAANANIGFWYLDRATNQVWLTEHCGTMLGLPPEGELTHETIVSAIHPDDRETVVDSMREAAHAGELALNEFRAVLPDGQTKWFLARSNAERDAQGQPVRISGFFMDITARKTAEAEAEQQRNELTHLMRVSVLGELSGAIAHELNQPLTAIVSNAQAAQHIMARDPAKLEEFREILDDIARDGTRAGEVIRRLRGLLKKGENKTETIDLNALAESTLRLLHGELINRKIKVDLDLAPDLPLPLGDPVHVQQVLLNLMTNAMEAMTGEPRARRVMTISTSATALGVAFVVADRGRGISADEQKRAFAPFFTTKENGLGLGLSICSRIIAAHGGELSLNTNADGGATATIRLPIATVQFATAAK